MTDLMMEIAGFLGIAALLGFVLAYLIWGYGRNEALSRARADGARDARTSVDGSEPMHEQIATVTAERDDLRAQLAAARVAAKRNDAMHEAPRAKLAPPAEDPVPDVDHAETLTEPAETLPEDVEATPPTPSSEAGPASLLHARPEVRDDLKMIKGIGQKMEDLLNSQGVYLFHQIANFTPEEVAWLDHAVETFPGRIARDKWVEQAQVLYRENYGKPHTD